MVGFPPTKLEARGTEPLTEIRDSAPSPQNLTGKRSHTCSVAPFVVELFMAGRLTRSPERSDSGPVCRQTGTPHASRVERTRSPRDDKARTPRTGFAPALSAGIPAARQHVRRRPPHRRGLAHSKRTVQGLSASPNFDVRCLARRPNLFYPVPR